MQLCRCRAAQLSDGGAAQLRVRLREVESELDQLREACAANERAAQARAHADARRQRDDAQRAQSELAEARAALRAEEARVKGQLTALSHAHVAEAQRQQAVFDEALAAAQAQGGPRGSAVQDALQAAEQIAADVSGMDVHLQKVRCTVETSRL